jgi:hypothetical protein
MPRRRRPLDRKSGVLRDASLIVIASEDTHAVKQYFDRFELRRVQFVVLPTQKGRSSPEALIERLDLYQEEFEIGDGDQLWIVLDTDHWIRGGHRNNLIEVLNRCRQRNFRFAISNPCFELWLLLHFQDWPVGNDLSCSEIIRQLRAVAGGYRKNAVYSLSITPASVEAAVERARSRDKSGNWFPDEMGTQVYRIIDELTEREAISFGAAP